MYYIRNLLIMAIGAPELKMDGLKDDKNLIASAISGLIEGLCGSETMTNPVIMRNEFIFDRNKISKNASACKSAKIIKFIDELK